MAAAKRLALAAGMITAFAVAGMGPGPSSMSVLAPVSVTPALATDSDRGGPPEHTRRITIPRGEHTAEQVRGYMESFQRSGLQPTIEGGDAFDQQVFLLARNNPDLAAKYLSRAIGRTNAQRLAILDDLKQEAKTLADVAKQIGSQEQQTAANAVHALLTGMHGQMTAIVAAEQAGN